MAPETAFQPSFADTALASPVLEDLRARARSRFETDGLPLRNKVEAWRFTPVSRVVEIPYQPAPAATAAIEGRVVDEATRLVLVNGSLDAAASDLGSLPEGVIACSMADALKRASELVEARLGQLATADDHPFVALNTAQSLDGAFVHVPAGLELERPIHLLNLTSGDEVVAYPRALVVIGEGARATLIEGFAGDGATLACPVSEVFLGAGAHLEHVRIQEEAGEANHVGALGVRLEGEAHYDLSSVFMGAELARLDLLVDLAGEQAHATLDGLTLGRERQHGTHQVRLRHLVPNCTSQQRFRSVVTDRSQSVFTGRIVVAEDAQKTDAEQSSRALLLSDQAVATNNPQLEIYADDVKCTHGSTVGQLDQEALFYLRTRGLDHDAAQALLTIAFAAEVLEDIPVAAIRERLETELGARLGGERTFEEIG